MSAFYPSYVGRMENTVSNFYHWCDNLLLERPEFDVPNRYVPSSSRLMTLTSTVQCDQLFGSQVEVMMREGRIHSTM